MLPMISAARLLLRALPGAFSSARSEASNVSAKLFNLRQAGPNVQGRPVIAESKFSSDTFSLMTRLATTGSDSGRKLANATLQEVFSKLQRGENAEATLAKGLIDISSAKAEPGGEEMLSAKNSFLGPHFIPGALSELALEVSRGSIQARRTAQTAIQEATSKLQRGEAGVEALLANALMDVSILESRADGKNARSAQNSILIE